MRYKVSKPMIGYLKTKHLFLNINQKLNIYILNLCFELKRMCLPQFVKG